MSEMPGLDEAAAALRNTDHTRLPVSMVAEIAVIGASSAWQADYDARVVTPLREECARLRRALSKAGKEPRRLRVV
jgi:hypothetical protein